MGAAEIRGQTLFPGGYKVVGSFDPCAHAVIALGDAKESLREVPDSTFKLIITSPPYNIGKCYEEVVKLEEYLSAFAPIIHELVRVLHPEGSICWQVGNYS